MGRVRTTNFNLPPGVHLKRGRFYYGRNDIALGSDYSEMLAKVASILKSPTDTLSTFQDAAIAYLGSDLFKAKKPKTQSEYRRQITFLCKAFPVQLDAIQPSHIAEFLTKRKAKIAATREKAVISLVFNYARMIGLTNAPNPCQGIRGKKSKRDRYVTDDELGTGFANSDPILRDFLELCYRTGADAGVVIKLTGLDIQGDELWIQRTKTGNRTRVQLIGPLRELVDRLILDVERGTSAPLIRNERGERMTLGALQKRFGKVKKTMGVTWRLKDLRAKAATDLEDLHKANALLGHSAMTTTDTYIKQHAGQTATPVMRPIADKAGDCG